jgi:hypothetical protein
MSKEFLDFVNRWRSAPLPDGDAGHDQLAAEMALMDPNLRQSLIDEHSKTLSDNPSVREYAEHYALGRKLKASHAALKRVGR